MRNVILFFSRSILFTCAVKSTVNLNLPPLNPIIDAKKIPFLAKYLLSRKHLYLKINNLVSKCFGTLNLPIRK